MTTLDADMLAGQARAIQVDRVMQHAMSRESGVRIPLLQAFVSGVLVFAGSAMTLTLLTFLVAYYGFHSRYTVVIALLIGFVPGIIAGSGIMVFVWFRQTNEWARFLNSLELVLRMDLDRNGTVGQGEQEPAGIRYDRLARFIIDRKYRTGAPVDRDTLEAERVCTQEDWNSVNKLLKQIGVKEDKTFVPGSYEEAMGIYNDRVSVGGDGVMLVKRNASGTNVSRIK